jgi:hypothetical protein
MSARVSYESRFDEGQEVVVRDETYTPGQGWVPYTTETANVPGKVNLNDYKRYDWPDETYILVADVSYNANENVVWSRWVDDDENFYKIFCFDRESGDMVASETFDDASFGYQSKLCVVDDDRVLMIEQEEVTLNLLFWLLKRYDSSVTRTLVHTVIRSPANSAFYMKYPYSHKYDPATGYGLSQWHSDITGEAKTYFTWHFNGALETVTDIAAQEAIPLLHAAIGDDQVWATDAYSYANMEVLSDGTFVDLAYSWPSDAGLVPEGWNFNAVVRMRAGPTGVTVTDWTYLDLADPDTINLDDAPYTNRDHFVVGWGTERGQAAIAWDETRGVLELVADYGYPLNSADDTALSGWGLALVQDPFGASSLTRLTSKREIPTQVQAPHIYTNDIRAGHMVLHDGFLVHYYSWIEWEYGIWSDEVTDYPNYLSPADAYEFSGFPAHVYWAAPGSELPNLTGVYIEGGRRYSLPHYAG